MSDDLITFNFCVKGKAGEVHLSDAGFDVVRAILIKLAEQAERGEEAATSMGGPRGSDYSTGQRDYFRAAKTFIMGRVANGIASRMNLRAQLQEVLQWRLGTHIPDRWAAAVLDASQEVTIDAPTGPADGGSGGGGDGVIGGHPLDDGQSGPTAAAGSPPVRVPDDIRQDVPKVRPTPKRSGSKPTATGG